MNYNLNKGQKMSTKRFASKTKKRKQETFKLSPRLIMAVAFTYNHCIDEINRANEKNEISDVDMSELMSYWDCVVNQSGEIDIVDPPAYMIRNEDLVEVEPEKFNA